MAIIIGLFPLLVWLIPGIVGGGMTALAIKWADRRLDTKNFVTITSGWAVGMTLGGIAGQAIYIITSSDVFDDKLAWIIGMGIAGLVIALIGSLTTCTALESLATNENAG